MSSPFPGVDPYIEAQNWWRDFHSKFTNVWQDELLDRLPEDYDARIDEQVYLMVPDENFSKLIVPDIAIDRRGLPFDAPETIDGEQSQGGVATATLTLPPPPYEVRESFIQILHQPDRSLVAVLELLSPTNKGTHYGTYLAKRSDILQTPVHLVELDLLISGRKPPMMQPLPPGQFHVFISRGDKRPKCDVSGWNLRRPLPQIRIPLLRPDEHVVSDLQAVYDTAYTRARYERAIDYGRPLDLPLSDEDRNWLAARLPSAS